MTTYKDIRGTHIKTVTADPPAPVSGQMWYNSTGQVMKGFTSNPAGSWSTGGTLNTAGYINSNGAGTATEGLTFGRYSSGGDTGETEQYNGSSWTEVNDLNTGRNSAAAGGTYTAALMAGGATGPATANTESWNGSSWTEVNNLNSAKRYLAGAIGVNTAGLAFGGLGPPSGVAETENWNGTSWTEVADLNNARRSNAGNGTNSNAGAWGGYDGSNVANTEIWNGSAWTEVADQSNAGGGASFGIYNDALKTSGSGNVVELWNGTAWSSGTNATNSFTNRGGLGTTSAGLLIGGEPPGTGVTNTEEWVAPTTSTVTFTAS